MLFNSFAFLGFLALVVAAYYVLPHRWRWLLLLVASGYFYSTFQPAYLLLLAYATGVAYLVGLGLTGRGGTRFGRILLALGVIGELSVLALFKYFDFLAASIEGAFGWLALSAEPIALPRLEFLLPAGLSFYVFSAISYLVDVRRGSIPPERHFGKLALYIAFFPKLLAGPIERAGPFLAQLEQKARFEPAVFTFGLQLLLWGMFKKVVIADRLAAFVDAGFSSPDFQSPATVLVAVYFYAFQIYCDFSGYSDMAIGASALFGIKLMENFRRPYFAKSVPEFWSRRWHISLMAWFRDYVYIPLGGNRVSTARWYANVMIVFLISGLWHGANWTFVVWGGLNGLYQIVYLMLGGLRTRVAALLPAWLWNTLAVLLTFHLITLSWIFFRADSFAQAWAVIGRIQGSLLQMPTLLAAHPWTGEFWLALGLIVFLIGFEALDEKRGLWQWLEKRPVALRWGFYYTVLACLVVVGQWGLSEFVYMRF
ncbi:MBOAT family O-acyltransferase [Chelativorans sp. Marseille-P2723]|uniref:MBOAT family O-acyltransferase n=1 Tax=Chelativorans sp. Marseille-P2723 TaxID=2709133 RepID=UPI00157092EE|nr:MBOAT family O-acyltransferase [Chelativorans sp. Marseille-P2723]